MQVPTITNRKVYLKQCVPYTQYMMVIWDVAPCTMYVLCLLAMSISRLQQRPGNLTAQPPNIVHGCSWQRMAAARFTSEWPGSVILLSKHLYLQSLLKFLKQTENVLDVPVQCSLSWQLACSTLHQVACNLVTNVISMVDEKYKYEAMTTW